MTKLSRLKRGRRQISADVPRPIKRYPGISFGFQPWDVHQDEAIRALFPDFKLLQEKLPHRTYAAIKARASKIGLKVGIRRAPWTTAETKILKAGWGNPFREKLFRSIPNHTKAAVSQRAFLLGLTNERSEYFKPWATGNAAMDAIRDRAWQDKIPLSSLEKEIGTGQYFQQFPTLRRLDWNRIALAVEYFGGRLVIDWQDD